MASYPASVKTFTTKNPGDVVQPADINDPQDEITAMQDGLLNGTARLNSSNSTVVTLTVSGAATFSSVVSMLQQPMCRLRHTSTQSIPDGSFTGLVFDTDDIDVGAMHAAPSSVVTFPSTGYYYISAFVRFAGNSSGVRAIRLVHSTDGEIRRNAIINSGSGGDVNIVVSDLYRIASTAHSMTVEAFQNSGGALESGGNAISQNHWFAARRVG